MIGLFNHIISSQATCEILALDFADATPHLEAFCGGLTDSECGGEQSVCQVASSGGSETPTPSGGFWHREGLEGGLDYEDAGYIEVGSSDSPFMGQCEAAVGGGVAANNLTKDDFEKTVMKVPYMKTELMNDIWLRAPMDGEPGLEVDGQPNLSYGLTTFQDVFCPGFDYKYNHVSYYTDWSSYSQGTTIMNSNLCHTTHMQYSFLHFMESHGTNTWTDDPKIIIGDFSMAHFVVEGNPTAGSTHAGVEAVRETVTSNWPQTCPEGTKVPCWLVGGPDNTWYCDGAAKRGYEVSYLSADQNTAPLTQASGAPRFYYDFDGSTETAGLQETPSSGVVGFLNEYVTYNYPHIRKVFSYGGWTLSGQMGPILHERPDMVEKLAKDIVTFTRANHFNGVDIDWEHPGGMGCLDDISVGCAAETQDICGCGPESEFIMNDDSAGNFYKTYADFLAAIRSEMNAQEVPNMDLTIAVSAAPTVFSGHDWTSILKSVDLVNLMSYDYFGSWNTNVGPNSGLYCDESQGGSNTAGWCVAGALKTIQEQNLDAGRFTVGWGTYGRGWNLTGGSDAKKAMGTNLPWSLNDGTANGFSATTGAPALIDNNADQAGFAFYRSIAMGRQGTDMVRGFDEASKTPYIIGQDPMGTPVFWSYEDEQSLWWKGNFIIEHGFAGEIVWDLSGDLYGELKMYLFNLLEAGSIDTYTPPADPFVGC